MRNRFFSPHFFREFKHVLSEFRKFITISPVKSAFFLSIKKRFILNAKRHFTNLEKNKT